MPRVSSIQTNFTAGEISPKVSGRVDVARYQNGAEALENVIVDVYGGAARAPGTEYLAPAIDAAVRSRLIPFQFNRDTAYHLEFGNLVMRVFRSGAGQVLSSGVPYQIATPYTADEVRAVRYAQASDTMFMAHPNHPIQSLRRLADDSWVLSDTPISVYPFGEVGAQYPANMTLSDTTIGTGRTATLDAPFFTASDVGRRITFQSGAALITAYTDTSHVTIQILTPFPHAFMDGTQWVLEDSPQTTLTPSIKGTVGQGVTLTLTASGWRNEDANKFVTLNGGLLQITAVQSATVASGLVKADMESNAAAPAGAWTLQGSAWGTLNGNPTSIAIYQQRLVAGGNTKYPNGVWGSKTGLYLDFTQGDEDSDGYFYALDGESNGIQHLTKARALIALTPGTEWTLEGGVEKPLTPTNVQAKDQTVYGCSTVRPERIGDQLLFVQRAGRKIRSMGYQAASDSFRSPNLTTLSEHVTESGIVEMSYQQEPGSVLWAVRNDGQMASLTIDTDESVAAWTRQTTDGAFESVSCVPAGDVDEVLVIVRRVVNGQTVRYVERLNADFFVHAGITGTSADGANVWDDLDHLEGKVVSVLADGSPMGQFTVTGGAITLPRNAKAVQIGLPVTPRVKLLRPEISTQTGTAQSTQMHAHKYSVLFYQTAGTYLNGNPFSFLQFGKQILDKPPEPFSGWKDLGELGWDAGQMTCEFTQPDPMSFHILAVVRHWTTNE